MTKNKNHYNLQFFLLCGSTFLFFGSFNMVIGELPEYLRSLGGEQYIGLIISLFTLTAGASRPFSGKLTDLVGRIPIMVFGVVVSSICGLLYIYAHSILIFFVIRLLHGMSTGFTPTGTSAYLADVTPLKFRGEAMGIIGVCSAAGMAMGPYIGSSIALMWGMNAMFVSSSVAALLSICILLGMKESLENPQRLKLEMLKLNRSDLFEPKVWLPAIIMLLTTYSFGLILTLSPDFSVHLGVSNKGLFFSYVTLSTLFMRLIAGKASDVYGREIVVLIALVLLVFAMFYISQVTTATAFLIGGCLYGASYGMISPTTFAWTIDLSPEETRGKSMSTLYLALEIGIGFGALISGYVYANQAINFGLAFRIAGVLGIIAFMILLWNYVKKPGYT